MKVLTKQLCMIRVLTTIVVFSQAALLHAGETIPHPPPARIPTYTYEILPVLDGYQFTEVSSLNDYGQVAGRGTRFFVRDIFWFQHQACLFENGQAISLGTSAINSRALAINNFGRIVGADSELLHGFLWDNGVVTDLGSLGPNGTGLSVATDVNDFGQVVGWASPPVGGKFPFLWENGIMINLGNPGGSVSENISINNFAQVVGTFYSGPSGPNGSFFWENGSMVTLPGLNGSNAIASGINNYGEVVGSTGGYAVKWVNGQIQHLTNPPCHLCGSPVAINDFGDAVGGAGVAPLDIYAALFYRGHIYDLNVLRQPETSYHLEIARDINNAGQIIVSAFDATYWYYAFLLTPTNCDIDGEGNVNLADLQRITECASGPRQPFGPDCSAADVDQDGDIDLLDYRSFELAFEP